MNLSDEGTTLEHPQWFIWEGVIPKDVCEAWVALAQDVPHQEARTFRTGEDENADGTDNYGDRKTQIRWLANEGEFQGLHTTLWNYGLEANRYFQTLITELPPVQYTEYNEVGSHYGQHHDIDWNRQDGKHRKISITIQLSDPDDYDGGDFSFAFHQNPDPAAMRTQGTIIAFLSYQDHSVSPITRGKRNSMVAWFEGPRWR